MTRCVALILATLAVGCGPMGPFTGMFGGGRNFGYADQNRDGNVDETELGTWADDSGYFEAWRAKPEATGFTADDVAYGLFDQWTGGGDMLTADQWGEYMATWFPDVDRGNLADWDTNGDQKIDQDELAAGFKKYDVLKGWKVGADGTYSQEEVLSHLYKVLDTNGDGKINDVEWNRVMANMPESGGGGILGRNEQSTPAR